MIANLNDKQYQSFLMFATTASSKRSIAQIGTESKAANEIGNDTGTLKMSDGTSKIVKNSKWDNLIGFKLRRDSTKRANDMVRDLFKNTILAMFKANDVDELPQTVQDAMLLDDFGKGKPLTARRIRDVDTSIRAHMAVASEKMPFTGKAASQICEMLLSGSGLEGEKEPEKVLQQRMQNICTAKTKIHAPKVIANIRNKNGELDMTKFATSFEADLNRNFPIQFNGGKLLSTMSTVDARNECVKFLTDGKCTDYDKADDKTKIMVATLIAYTTQGLCAGPNAGVSQAFDKNCTSGKLGIGDPLGTIGKRDDVVNVTKNENGDITIHNRLSYKPPYVFIADAKGAMMPYEVNEGATVEFDFTMTITADSLEKFANADWKTLDLAPITKMDNSPTEPHNTERAAEMLPAEFQLDITTDLKFSANIDTLTPKI